MVPFTALALLAGFSASYATSIANNAYLSDHSGSGVEERSVGNASQCTFQFYDQQIDHFGQYNGTFKQRYNLITKFFKPGGPILYFQGEESISLDCVVSSLFPKIKGFLN
jgi:hypothetical protein